MEINLKFAKQRIENEGYTVFTIGRNRVQKLFGLTARQAINLIKSLRKEYPDDNKYQAGTRQEETSDVQYGRDFINIVCASKRLLSEEDLIKQFGIDKTKWEIDVIEVKSFEGYRKDKKVDWDVVDGKVTNGSVRDSGKMLVVPMYAIRAKFARKTVDVRNSSVLTDLIADAKLHSPKTIPIKYPKRKEKDGLLYEIDIPDIHFGRLTWEEESGDNYDIKIARRIVNSVLDDLLHYSKSFPVAKILLPIGNDMMNVDNKEGTTTRGTPQQEDTRWQKTFRIARQLLVEMIDKCQSIAPVDALVISGNHDEQRMFMLGDALECWYHANKNVSVDNSARKRKYYPFGCNLIGFTHGCWEKLDRLPFLMSTEVPNLWANSKYREWHTGDKHFKKDVLYKTDESSGMVIRILRSVAGLDAWTFDKGFIGSLKAAESFMWSPTQGVIAQFTSPVKREYYE